MTDDLCAFSTSETVGHDQGKYPGITYIKIGSRYLSF